MRDLHIDGIEGLYFRANTAYKIVAFRQLSDDQQKLFEELTEDTDFYGLLLPRERDSLCAKSVDRNTALLYRKLSTPSLLPVSLKRKLGEELNKVVSNLVFENILEVRIRNLYISGLDAFEMQKEQMRRTAEEPSGSVIRQLSIEALKYAQSLDINDISGLAARIYLYNCRPLTPSWKNRFPTSESLHDFLGTYANEDTSPVTGKYQTDLTNDSPDKYWINWKHSESETDAEALRYKLYVSPDPKILRDALPFIFEAFSVESVACFKLGKDLRGIFRPDKIVAYFKDFDKLNITAEHLRSKLAGQPAHGVPFTSAITDNGMLSWAIDPPASEKMFSWHEEDSWRTWIAKRLAAAMIESKANNRKTDFEPWQYALECVRLQGIDIQTWLPAETR